MVTLEFLHFLDAGKVWFFYCVGFLDRHIIFLKWCVHRVDAVNV